MGRRTGTPVLSTKITLFEEMDPQLRKSALFWANPCNFPAGRFKGISGR
jgi:hypothetical protein